MSIILLVFLTLVIVFLMGASQSLPSFIFPEISEADLKNLVSSLNSNNKKETNFSELKYERTLGKGRVSWSMLVRDGNNLLLMRLYAKKGSNCGVNGNSGKPQTVNRLMRKRSSSLLSMDPLSATKLSFIHELYYEKCSQFDFVLKPLLITDSDDFLILLRPFARYNLPDRLNTESLNLQDKLWIGTQLMECFLRLHSLRAYHGDFGCGKIFLTSQNKVIIGDFAPVKPFCLQSKNQPPIEFYQIWFDEGLDGEGGEIGRGCYLAPERLKFNVTESFESADLFSLGCVLAEIFGTRSFLQFKDVLKLSSLDSDASYNENLTELIDNCEISETVLIPLIKRLCTRDPARRYLAPSDISLFKLDQNVNNWRNSISLYRKSDDFYEKKKLITETFIGIPDNLESFLILLFKENDSLLIVLLVNYLLNHVDENFVSVISESFKDNQFVQRLLSDFLLKNPKVGLKDDNFQLIKSFNSGNRDVLFQQIAKESDLKSVLNILQSQKIPKEKMMGILNKLLQIYRSRDVHDEDFESQMVYEYVSNGAEKEDLDNLYKICSKFNETSSSEVTVLRIAFQLDLEKNCVPIESPISNQKKQEQFSPKPVMIAQPRLKQRILLNPIKWKGAEMIKIQGILQSPDKLFFICYSDSTIFFWDMKSLLDSKSFEPVASVNPRSDAIITSLIFGTDSELIISFKDGIIGIYRFVYKNLMVEFCIKESFGPFEDENLKLLLTITKSGKVLLVIGKGSIFGIRPHEGEILFEIRLKNGIEIELVIEIIDASLFCIDARGQFILIEIYYETGQILCKWSLEYDDCHKNMRTLIESASLNSNFELVLKLSINSIGRLILVFLIDPLKQIATCKFRHWIITEKGGDDKNLPIISFAKCDAKHVDNSTGIDTENGKENVNTNTLCVLKEEIVEISFGVLRLIDFNQISSSNSTSILYPQASIYKPTLKLRNKRGKVPEIIEKIPNDFEVDFKEKDHNNEIIQKLCTNDGKNHIIVAIIDNSILMFC